MPSKEQRQQIYAETTNPLHAAQDNLIRIYQALNTLSGRLAFAQFDPEILKRLEEELVFSRNWLHTIRKTP